MIEVAGDGVAMGNASPEVKAAADHVAPAVRRGRRGALPGADAARVSLSDL